MAATKDTPERRPTFTTLSGLDVPRTLGPEDLPADLAQELGAPGAYPFTRGIHPGMYRTRLWTMRQYAGFGDAEETNRRFRFLLAQGQMGLSVAFDLPTQMGLDSDDPRSEGEVGKVGVAIDTLDDMERLFEGIPLGSVSTSMTINAPASILMLMYAEAARRTGVPDASVRGTVQNDILKEYVARGTYIFPPRPSLRLVTDTFGYATEHLPHFNPISVSGYHIREAGASAPREVAFTLANALAYVRAARQAGLDIDRIARRLSFFFNAHMDFFEEIAKFRAARRLWANLMKEEGATDPEAMRLRFHAQTAGSALTAQQPDVNVVRVAIQALSAVLGGAQSLHTNAFDEALGLPTETSALLALRTQQVIAAETGVASTADPMGGSFWLESLTARIEEEARGYLAVIDTMGGAVAAIESGYMQRQIEEASWRFQREVETGEREIVGVNLHVEGGGASPPILDVDPAIEVRQRERLSRVRAGRDTAQVKRSLARLADEAAGRGNLLLPLRECVSAYASVGEMCRTLTSVFGTYHGDREEMA